MADALEKHLGEVVLFALGAAVNRESNTMLYRFHDDFWLCGEPTVCAKAWTTIKQFATIMGLEFNKKTGSAYISTGSGVGKAVVQLVWRNPGLKLQGHSSVPHFHICVHHSCTSGPFGSDTAEGQAAFQPRRSCCRDLRCRDLRCLRETSPSACSGRMRSLVLESLINHKFIPT
jgi:hypothetical protein